MIRVGDIYSSENYGSLEVIEYLDSKNVTVRFIKTGYVTTSRSDHIRNGKVKDKLLPNVHGVGYIGVGDYLSGTSAGITKQYVTWNGMLERCYCSKLHEVRPTYIGCSVVPEWHNFQNFAKWYDENHPKDGVDYHLDKDIRVPGNKVYGPKTCLFVTIIENTIAASCKNEHVLRSPYDILYLVKNISEFCREHGLNNSALSQVLRGERPHHKNWKVG